jgi:molybdenum cofactor cytidylyltransferase
MKDVGCVMLAAGSSTRMDSWKMLLRWGAATIVEQSVETALRVCSRLILVAGFRAGELMELFCERSEVEVVVNADFHAGMFSSVRRGAEAVAEGPFFLALADMPGVSEEVYQNLLEWGRRLDGGFAAAGTAYAVIPQYRGKKGHPLLLCSGMRARILQADSSGTLRDVLVRVANVVVPVNEPGILHDIDTPADYRSWDPSGPAGPAGSAR